MRRYQKTFFWAVTIVFLLVGGWQIATVAISRTPTTKDIIINEFVAANRTGLADEDGDYVDWIELYNPNDHAINLSGWSLTDEVDQPEKWTFPEMTLDSQAYLVIFASGKDRRVVDRQRRLHTNFKLNRDGEFLGLYNIHQDKFVAAAASDFPRQFSDVAYGRYGAELLHGYLARPTPGQPNDETTVWRGSLEPVQFSAKRGFYDSPLTVVLTSTTPGATIRYTTNGSQPSETNGFIYSEPVLVEGTTLLRAGAFYSDYLPSPSETHSYIFLADVLSQPAQPPGFPPTWGRHEVDFGGYEADQPVIADYEVDPDIVNDPRYQEKISDALKAIPTLSIVTDIENFHLYANPRKRGVAWERPASVELIYPDGQREGFQHNAGIRIQGGAGRWEFMPKHSLRLFFKDMYGASKLEYPLFPDSPVERFDTLVLRAGVDRSYAGHPEVKDHTLTTYTRDEWLRASQIALSGVGSHGMFVHLYLNGLYWGLYNVVERPDASFAASYLGGKKDEWYAVNHGGGVSGSSDRFKALMNLVDEDKLRNPEKYAQVQNYLDVKHFIDYLILNWYAGTKDWPENNWYANVHNPEGQIKYFVWDGEESWNDGAAIHLGRDDLAGVPNTIKRLFEALIENPNFAMTLADRFYKHLFNDGLLTDARAQERWRQINAPLELAIIGESMRWGDARYDPSITQSDWLEARDEVSAQMAGNAAKLIAQARVKGYYPDFDPPLFNQQGGLVPAGFNLTMTSPTGLIYYTTDGSDPRNPVNGDIAPTAAVYQGPLVLTTTTSLKARVLITETSTEPAWSALNEATFVAQTYLHQLHITEIMYNPPGGSDYEFIELKNTGDGAISLAGATFVEGIRFTFPLDIARLSPGQTIILAADAEAFAKKYPHTPIAGVYDRQLSNEGETIVLVSLSGNVMASVTYDDENGWPISPDGRGDSLVLTSPGGDPNNPVNWRASYHLGGSPGLDEIRP